MSLALWAVAFVVLAYLTVVFRRSSTASETAGSPRTRRSGETGPVRELGRE
jgi:hypothetical protein